VDDMKKSIHPISGSILLVVILSLLSFLPLSNKLGFYFNDWHPVLSKLTNTSLFNLFKIDRPVLGLIYPITTKIFGMDPFLWQLFGIFLRTLGAIVFFTILIQIWPKEWKQLTLMSGLMVLYPGFSQQPIALTFSNHFIGIILGLSSISLSIFILKHEDLSRVKKIILILLTLGFEFSYLVIYEYMIGFEPVRWVFIWYILFPNSLFKFKRNFVQWLKTAYYYLIPVGVFLFVRIFIFKSGRQTTDIGYLLNTYLTDPLQMVGKIIVDSFHAILNTTLFAWFIPIYNAMEFIKIQNLIFAIFVGIIALSLMWTFLTKFNPSTTYKNTNDRDWRVDIVVLGSVIVIFTLVPIIITNREVAFRDLLDRYTLQSAFGVSMLVVGLANLIFTEKIKVISIYFLIFISILFNISNSVIWKNNWESQRKLFWQLAWRAPQIESGTVGVVQQPKGYLFREDEDFYAPANLIYYPSAGSLQIVSEVFNVDTARNIIFQETTYRNYRSVQFTRDFKNLLIISNSSQNACVHIIDGGKPELSANEIALVRLVASYSNIAQIIPNGTSPIIPENPFGKEPEHDWCYFYQKANLARQKGDWTEVLNLANDASLMGFLPGDPSEWMPFIEAYAVTDQLNKASDLIQDVRNNTTVWMNICQNYDGDKRNLTNWEVRLNEQLCVN
jgi:hypothetical protein